MVSKKVFNSVVSQEGSAYVSSKNISLDLITDGK